MESRVLLHSCDLLTWNKWTPLGKAFIKEEGDDIVIRDAVIEYETIVQSFYAWFTQALKTRHRDDLDVLADREAELGRLSPTD